MHQIHGEQTAVDEDLIPLARREKRPQVAVTSATWLAVEPKPRLPFCNWSSLFAASPRAKYRTRLLCRLQTLGLCCASTTAASSNASSTMRSEKLRTLLLLLMKSENACPVSGDL